MSTSGSVYIMIRTHRRHAAVAKENRCGDHGKQGICFGNRVPNKIAPCPEAVGLKLANASIVPGLGIARQRLVVRGGSVQQIGLPHRRTGLDMPSRLFLGAVRLCRDQNSHGC
jgi:hypothetical protein